MKWFLKLKGFFKKKSRIAKALKIPAKEKPKRIKFWYNNNYKDHYCKWIENGHEMIGIITNTQYQSFDNGKSTKAFSISGHYEYFGLSSEKVVVLGRSVDELTRLKCDVLRLRKQAKNQKTELAAQHKALETYMKTAEKEREIRQKARKELLSSDELQEYLVNILNSPILSLTSGNEKERELAKLILNEFKKKNIEL